MSGPSEAVTNTEQPQAASNTFGSIEAAKPVTEPSPTNAPLEAATEAIVKEAEKAGDAEEAPKEAPVEQDVKDEKPDLVFNDEDESDEDQPKVLKRKKRRPIEDDEDMQEKEEQSAPSAPAAVAPKGKRGRKSAKELEQEALNAPKPEKFVSLGARVPSCLSSRPAAKQTPPKRENITCDESAIRVGEEDRAASDEPFAERDLDQRMESEPPREREGSVFHQEAPAPARYVHPEVEHALGGTKEDDQGRTLLCWNETGSILRTGEDGVGLLYEVEHGDGSTRFRSQENFVKGAVGRNGACFAAQTTLKVMQFAGNGVQACEWERDVAEYESISCCCVTRDHVAVCTSGNGWTLRIFSLGGIWTAMMNLPGAPVACVGGGSLLAVFYNNDSGLSVLVLDLKKNQKVCQTSTCLGGENQLTNEPSRLKWCHISSTERIYIIDDTNTMRQLVRQFGDWMWTPVLKLRDNPEVSGQDMYHPHSVEDSKPDAEFFFAKLPTSGTLPLAPRPMLSKEPLKFPRGKEPDNDEEAAFASGEEMILRKEIWYAQEMLSGRSSMKKLTKSRNKQLDRAVVTMFTQAAAKGEASKCVDLAKRIKMKTVLEGAGKLAYEHGLPRVSEIIQGFLRERAASEAVAPPKANPGPISAPVVAPPQKQEEQSNASSRPVSANGTKMFGKQAQGSKRFGAPTTTAPEPVVAKKRKLNPFGRK